MTSAWTEALAEAGSLFHLGFPGCCPQGGGGAHRKLSCTPRSRAWESRPPMFHTLRKVAVSGLGPSRRGQGAFMTLARTVRWFRRLETWKRWRAFLASLLPLGEALLEGVRLAGMRMISGGTEACSSVAAPDSPTTSGRASKSHRAGAPRPTCGTWGRWQHGVKDGAGVYGYLCPVQVIPLAPKNSGSQTASSPGRSVFSHEPLNTLTAEVGLQTSGLILVFEKKRIILQRLNSHGGNSA